MRERGDEEWGNGGMKQWGDEGIGKVIREWIDWGMGDGG